MPSTNRPLPTTTPIGVAAARQAMIHAIDAEIRAICGPGGTRPISLSGGPRQDRSAVPTYRIPRPTHLAPRSGNRFEEAQFRAEDLDMTVRVHVAGEHILLQPGRDLGPELPPGDLYLDTAWMLRALRDRISEPQLGFNHSLAGKVLGIAGRPEIGAEGSGARDDAISALNRKQRGAVSLSLRSDLTYIWGPPGTGKTTTLAALIEAHYRDGRRVLALAPSNHAADVLAVAVAHRLRDDPEFARGILLRFGSAASPELQQRYGAEVLFERVLERVRDNLLSQVTDAEGKRRTLRVGMQRTDEVLQACVGGAPVPAPEFVNGLRQELGRQKSIVEELDQQVDRGRRTLSALPRRLIDRCPILVTTIHRAYLPGQLDRLADTVVIDEAGMTPLAAAYYVAGLGRSVVIAGDFRQLPAVVQSRKPDAQRWLGTDAFHAAGIPSAVEHGNDPPSLVVLTDQHRMDQPICDLVSALSYDGRLITAPAVLRRPLRSGFGTDAALLYVDTSGLDQPASLGRENLLHAGIVRSLVARYTASAIPHRGESPTCMLGVITPYVAQANRIRRVLGARFGHVPVATVHRFQGSEMDTVILDIPERPGIHPSTFLTARSADDVGARLLNVAASRARRSLLVVADFAHLRATTPPGGFTARFLDRIEAHGQTLPAADLLRFPLSAV